jgi:cytochrome o ubiquinol oxidase subunit 3
MSTGSITEHKLKSETVFGFWVYIMTDCMIFASLFATFAVLRHAYAGGPTGAQIFDLKTTFIETVLLLLSSTSCGFAMLSVHQRRINHVTGWLLVTFCLGAGFVGMEVTEFMHLVAIGAGPDRSAYLSAFFTLVGTHGLHVSCGLIWMSVLMIQVKLLKGLTDRMINRLIAFSLFWHFLDIIWIFLFTFVYLNGVL